MIDIVDRLRFDATRCEVQFSKGVAGNIEAAVREIERLRAVLKQIADTGPDKLPENPGNTGNCDDQYDYGYEMAAWYDAELARFALSSREQE